MKLNIWIILLLIGLIMSGAGLALDQYYKSHLADKNGDGVVDWKDADVNGDRRVDISDIMLIASNNGKPASDCPRCDLNNDDLIDRYDLELAKAFYGEGLNILTFQTNQGKFFLTGLIVAAMAVIGLMVTKRRR